MNGYKVTIKSVHADHEMTAKERIMFKDTTNAIKLDEATQDQEDKLMITPVAWGVLAIHNDKSDNPDYDNYIVVDKTGDKYVTGSKAFWSAFETIVEEIQDEGVEDWGILVYRMPSKNYKGKDFITCSVI